MWAGLIAYGLMQDQLKKALFGEEDEDGNLIYDKIPDYTLEHNLILPDLVGVTDRSFITIPFPYGFNMAFNTGRSLSRWSRGAYTQQVRQPIAWKEPCMRLLILLVVQRVS